MRYILSKIENKVPRVLMSLLILATCVVPMRATDMWDGVTVATEFAGGDGSQAAPYQIATGAQLKLLQSKTSGSNPQDWLSKHYVLTDDIDLVGHALGMIGNGTHGSPSSWINAFTGVFDGNGHIIRNLAINISSVANAKCSFGLFGYIYGGKVRNLTLLSPVITLMDTNPAQDIKVGFVAGALSPVMSTATGQSVSDLEVSTIENVIVRSGRMVQGSASANYTVATAFIGGIVGDISSGISGYTEMYRATSVGTVTQAQMAYGSIRLRNLYVNADFDLPNVKHTTTEGAKYTQYNLGGILGRMRRGRYDMVPENTHFTGKINAPTAIVGPSWSMLRANGESNNNLNPAVNAWAGEVYPLGSLSIASLNASEVTIGGATVYPDANRFYSNFGIHDGTAYREITDEFPATGSQCQNGTRALRGNTTAAAGKTTYTHTQAADMYMMQGVNHGTYEPVIENVLSVFNNYVADNPGLLEWDSIDGSVFFKGELRVNLKRNSHDTLTAEVNNCSSDVSYLWEGYSETTGTWSDLRTVGPTSNYTDVLAGISPEITKVRITVTPTTGEPIDSEVALGIEGLVITRSAREQFTGNFYSNYNSEFKVTWQVKRRDNDQWETLTEKSVNCPSTPNLAGYYPMTTSITEADFGDENLFGTHCPEKYSAIRILLTDVTDAYTYPAFYEFEMPVNVTVVRGGSAAENGGYTFVCDASIPLYGNQTATLGALKVDGVTVDRGFRYVLSGERRDTHEIVDNLAFSPNNNNGVWKQTLTYYTPSNYCRIIATMYIDGIPVGSGDVAINQVWIDPVKSERETHSTFIIKTTSAFISSRMFTYKAYGIPWDTVDEPADLYTNPDYLLASIATDATYFEPTISKNKCVDKYRIVRFVLCGYHNVEGNKAVPGDPLIDENGDYVHIDFEIEPISLAIVREGTEIFRADVVGNLRYGTQNYDYKWFAVRKSDGVEVPVTLKTGLRINQVRLKNADDYETIKCYLYDAAGVNQLHSPESQVWTQIAVEPALYHLNVRVSRVTNPVAGNSMYVAGVYSDSELEYGGGTPVQGGDGNVTVTGDVPLPEGYFWNWEVTSDPSSRVSWESTTVSVLYDSDASAIGRQGWIAPWSQDRYYRAALCRILYQTDGEGNYVYDSEGHRIPMRTTVTDANGITRSYVQYERISEDVGGPRRIVFVYDKAKTEVGRSMIVSADGVDTPVTTFDGIDHSVIDEAGNPLRDIYGNEYESVLPDGDNSRTGYAPYAAVRSLKRAYELLDAANGMDDNIIVIMGYYYTMNDMSDPYDVAHYHLGLESQFAKRATISGKWGNVIDGGAINMIERGGDSDAVSLGAATTFRHLTFVGFKNPQIVGTPVADADGHVYSNNSWRLKLYANRHDLIMDEGIRMLGYDREPQSSGLIAGSYSPYVTLVAGELNYNKDYSVAEIPDRPDNIDPDYTTMIVRSGCYSRIILGSRNTQQNAVSNNIYGSLQKPHRVKFELNIVHEKDLTTNTVIRDDYTPGQKYDYDVGMIVGGQTDGTVYSETEMNLVDGFMGVVISGNISYGRAPKAADGKTYPADTFVGSVTTTIHGGEIEEFFGGTLGRHSVTTQNTELCDAYFYGKSKVEIAGGEIRANIYGAGSGGVTGVGRCDHEGHHTGDPAIPYCKNGETVASYGSYDEIRGYFMNNKPAGWDANPVVCDYLPKFPMADGTYIPLGESHSEVVISGGVIQGDIFGGGYGYSHHIKYDRALSQAGDLFGSALVTVKAGPVSVPVINGNIYGGGSGSEMYVKNYAAALTNKVDNPVTHKVYTAAEALTAATEKFGKLARVFGNVEVNLISGIVNGHVFGGSMGIGGYNDMATIFGNVTVNIGTSTEGNTSSDPDADGPVIDGHVFGGGDFANIHFSDLDEDHTLSGSTEVNVYSGILGNCIFGGSWGSDGSDGRMENCATIAGNTTVNVLGGWFKENPYINNTDSSEGMRMFNIYGGGYLNCTIDGESHVSVRHSLMRDSRSFEAVADNPNHWTGEYDASGVWKPVETKFQAHYMDISYRKFCIYGAGHGEKTRSLNAHVIVDLPSQGKYTVAPDRFTLKEFLKGQSFFDIAGGGYKGDVGYWAPNVDNAVTGERKLVPGDEGYYSENLKYVGGNCKVEIDGYTYARKIIGGGFYGSSFNTDTDVRCGSLRQIYGGSLLGYVHNRALLKVGNKWEDLVAEGLSDDEALQKAAEKNRLIYVTENIYGGNDVKGIVGSALWEGPEGSVNEECDSEPLFCADVSTEENKGIVFSIYGGTFMGDVYGAGNGHYRGYYVPEWVRYTDGTPRMYSKARSSVDPTKYAHVYRSRPMTGSVNIDIRGNSETDLVNFEKNFYGGGRECTIGQWNTILPVEDPRRLVKGGHLHVNFGGHTHIAGNVYMGAYGGLYATQSKLPAGIDLDSFDGSTTAELNRLGNAAYDHWYFNSATNRYEPGFPAPGTVDGNYGLTGEHMFRGYMKNIEMQGNVELTFYRDIYRTDEQGNIVVDPVYKIPLRKPWLPGEFATVGYDATDITMTSFYLGGACGSMTNNTVMRYTYDDPKYVKPTDPYWGKEETWGAIYRIVLPPGLTIKDRVVMGSEDASLKYYRYNSDFTDVIKTRSVTETDPETGVETIREVDDPMYVFDGGMVTQSPIAFDQIAYNDYMSMHMPEGSKWSVAFNLPDDFYTSDNAVYANIRTAQYYDMHDGPDNTVGTRIYRYNYTNRDGIFPNFHEGESTSLGSDMYGMAVYYKSDDAGRKRPHAYIGQREAREASGEVTEWKEKYTVSKLFALCKFDPQFDCELDNYGRPDPSKLPADDPEGFSKLYGGLIFGGCYQSGIVMGDVVLNVTSDLLGDRIKNDEYEKWYQINTGLNCNLGRVFGGGFGANTRIDGDTYINLLHNVRAMNVFGGGMLGTVNGSTSVNYIGTESSAVYGAIYGGGFRGNVGIEGVTERATLVELISGNVAKVYGGSCMGNLFGSTYVSMSDQITDKLSHLDYNRLISASNDFERWGDARLIVGNAYGGNDISGNIYTIDPDKDTSEGKECSSYSTTIYVYEEPDEDSDGGEGGPGKDQPWAKNGYSGFPLVGRTYVGSNGNYGELDGDTQRYKNGTVVFSTGVGANSLPVDLGATSLETPHVSTGRLIVNGGTVVNAYGGGNLATITDKVDINIEYDPKNVSARAGFKDKTVLDRLWNVFGLESMEQQREIITESKDADGNSQGWVFNYQIYRLFGGNNIHEMTIQPGWKLVRGHVGNLYSGGNFGRMTYFNPNPEPNARGERIYGLKLEVDSPDIFIDNIYGGGRVGDIDPQITPGFDTDAIRVYGSTLTVNRGVINHVYGGNDVSGEVHYGTKVQINGAISGNVYCAGNGNYRYKYDPLLPETERIQEKFDDDLGGRYFLLPRKVGYGGENPSPAQRVLAINAYRPNVEQSYLRIAGTPGATPEDTRTAYVFGNVFCGGNSSTVHYDENRSDVGDIVFEVGSHVTLNSVFLGSDGSQLANSELMAQMEALNGFDLATSNDLDDIHDPSGAKVAQMKREIAESQGVPASEIDSFNVPNLYGVTSSTRYPRLLDLFMHAVDVNALPESFKIDDDITDAYLGDFFVGGNSGSMQTDKKISLTMPENLVIYGKVVGGSNNANTTYKSVTHVGGLTRPLADGETTKLHLTVKSRFEPWKLVYPVNEDIHDITLEPNLVSKNGKQYFAPGTCMIYGGCYSSGSTIGDIQIDLMSDMVREYDPAVSADAKITEALAASGGYEGKRRTIVNGIDDMQWRSFGLIGAGYGADSEVRGNVHVRMLPGKADWFNYTPGVTPESPSTATLFGGAQQGSLVGNTTIEVRDGLVLTNVYGGSESAPIYGSTQILVGWPKYYVTNAAGRGSYELKPTDNLSKPMRALHDLQENPTDQEAIDAVDEWTNRYGMETYAVRRRIALREGDIVSCEVYNMIVDDAKDTKFDLVDDDMPHNFVATADDGVTTHKPLTWDDIEISVGVSHYDDEDDFYGHGNIYGGGFIPVGASMTPENRLTVRRFDSEHCLDPNDVADNPLSSFGGNSTILIWDNFENADTDRHISALDAAPGSGEGSSGALIRDHISVSSGRYVKANIGVGSNLMGLYRKDAEGRYLHQPPHKIEDASDPLLQNEYYRLEADGGVYGGGRKVYVEGYRTCDLAYYGYANATPQYPKLINTAQHLDLLSVTDCCLKFNGAIDYSSSTPDGQEYSLTRIGELRMNSSILPNAALDPGRRTDRVGLFNILHEQPRSRNYVSFYNHVRYLAAITSNTPFNAPYHGANGVLYETGDYMLDESKKDDSNDPDIYDGSVAGVTRPANADFTYSRYKSDRVKYYYDVRDMASAAGHGDDDPLAVKARLAFDQRNVGTAPNMIGINNGNILTIEGAVTKADGSDHAYYGPATGVFEVKLLTLAEDEGGGYIFALNHHDDPNNFLETTGNFVFPGAAYLVSQDQGERYNYVYDDCFPMGRGWEYYYGWEPSRPGSTATPANRRNAPKRSLSTGASHTVDPNHGDTNQLQDVHYWYVNGSTFNFNVTITAYTSSEDEEFRLDNTNGIIYLYGLEPKKIKPGETEVGTDLYVRSVTWAPSPNTAPDLTYTDSGDRAANLPYSLYISVDDKPGKNHSLTDNADNAFVSAVSRNNYNYGAGEELQRVTNYSEEYDASGSVTRTNMPLVGITLYDRVHDYGDNTREYYDTHLREDENVAIQLVGGDNFTYNINLTIKYLLGPTITGEPAIENCALPGEYIYANAFGVNVDLDEENMSVDELNWYLLHPGMSLEDADLRQALAEFKATDETHVDHPIINITDWKVKDQNDQVNIPAYMHLQGYHLVYEIVANNRAYYRYPNKHNEAEEAAIEPYETQIDVHNYHRMRPWDGQTIRKDALGNPIEIDGHTVPQLEDLQFTAGCRIYIEDDADLARFLEYIREVQTPNSTRPTRVTPDGEAVDPQYAEGLEFYLMADVAMPKLTATELTALRNCVFRGIWHGNGFTVDLGDNNLFLGDVNGKIYNTGFLTNIKKADSAAFDRVTGVAENCFIFNPKDTTHGDMLASPAASNGNVINCYQTSLVPQSASALVNQASLRQVYNGEIAFNLNSFYLQKRYDNAKSITSDSYVKPVIDIYENGDYRYARWSETGVADALRTARVPNYHDYLNVRGSLGKDDFDGTLTGLQATMHNTAHLDDKPRGKTFNAEGVAVDYQPLFPADYLFFGQDLTEDKNHPTGVTTQNRVYRASGFYGFSDDLIHNCDYGFHFNENAVVRDPDLSAIDFAGYRDYENGNTYRIGDATFVNHKQQGFYLPMCDLPEKVKSFSTADGVTHNLLVYYHPATKTVTGDDDTPVTVVADPVSEVLAPGIYTRETPEVDIRYHVIDAPNEPDPNDASVARTPVATLFHLVDKHSFDAPIAFDVSEEAWYERLPGGYSYGNDAWESICLPFTVKTVHGRAYNQNASQRRDRGEISHFYGPAVDLSVEAPSHEYWLRKFTSVKGDKIWFTRPGSAEDAVNESYPDETRNYTYLNTFFTDVYKYFEGFEQDHVPDAYTAGRGATYENYPMITKRNPYIVAYPGRRFYEFDLSGQFYAEKVPGASLTPQTIVYKNVPDGADDMVHVPVTAVDGYPVGVQHDGYTLRGTFVPVKSDTATAAIPDVDEDDNGGSSFTNTEKIDVYPFRAYLVKPGSSLQTLRIASRGVDFIGGQGEDNPSDPEDEIGDALTPDLKVYTKHKKLVIESPFDEDLSLSLCDTTGCIIRYLDVHKGVNEYDQIAKGIYIVAQTKIMIK